MNDIHLKPLKTSQKAAVFLLSLVIVGFGQPATAPWLTFLAALAGYAGICRVLLDIELPSSRFRLGTVWFTLVQAIQLSWTLTHPYNYIYFVYFAFSLVCGLQWGFFALFVKLQNIINLRKTIALAALWTLLEWSRFFIFSGYSWNPSGLALTENLYSLQFATLGGIFLLSFWVLLINLTALRAWLLLPKLRPAYLTACLALLPYLFGVAHISYHDSQIKKQELASQPDPFRALLVQTAFPAEEALPFDDKQSYIAYVLDEWKQILRIVQPHRGKPIDLIALPEYVVPFGTYTFLYPYDSVAEAVHDVFGPVDQSLLPPLETPLARLYRTNLGDRWFVNNAFWVQTIANIFQSDVIVGLEDAEDFDDGVREHYSAAIHFKPNTSPETFSPKRYAKRVLLPLAEYIPFSWLHPIAANYGIQGSFTSGTEAIVFENRTAPFGVSICYEETFGNIMRECRFNGAELLVNLTSDVWYPNSNLPKQHFDHSRLRTVENGIPLVRACNTGVTACIDSLGRVVSMLGDTTPESQWISEALYVEAPRYHYPTIYSRYGDLPVILFCCIALLFFL